MYLLIRLLRAWIRVLSTDRSDVGAIEKFLRGALLVPAFGFALVMLWIRAAVRGPVIVEARARFGRTFRCKLPDLIQMYIALFDTWEPDLTQFIQERLRPGDVFIDVGANIGYYTLLASAKVGAAGAVVAIDALPSNFAELQHNLDINEGSANVRAINGGVSDARGTIDVYAGPAHNVGLATTAPGNRRNLRREASVPAAPLADFLRDDEIRRARVVKIDVEGGEPAVVSGMTRFLSECGERVEILLELSPAWWSDPALTPEAVLKPLRKAGFNTYVMNNSYWPWRYLWPRSVARPRRVQTLSDKRVKRIDLVVSRVDAEELLPPPQ